MKNNSIPTSTFLFLKEILGSISLSKKLFFSLTYFFSQITFIMLPFLIGFLIDKVFEGEKQEFLWFYLFPCVWLVSYLFIFPSKLVLTNIIQDVRKVTKQKLFTHFVNLPHSAFIDRDAGELESLMQELSFSTRYFFSENIPFFIKSSTIFIVSFVLVGYFSFTMLCLFLIWLIIFLPISFILSKLSVKHIEDSLVSSAKVSANTVDVIQNFELIPAFGTHQHEISRFENVLEEERRAFNRAMYSTDKADFLQKIVHLSLPFCLVYYIVVYGSYLTISPGEVASIFSFTLIFILQISDFGRGVLCSLEIIERLRVVLRKIQYNTSLCFQPHNPGHIKPDNWDIKFENISFSYTKDKPVLKNVCFEIRENEKVGIIGYSGAGKTSIIKLLKNFYLPTSGKIFVGGKNIESINSQVLSQNISEVSQSVPVFHRTIRENIAYGCPQVGDDEVWDVLKKAQLFKLVEQLPQGLSTVVGVRGQKFSGGERARIGIARALLRNSKIIIFDETMSSIDSESEYLIHEGIQSLIEGRTLITIAHRLSTLKRMEKIIVLDHGEIVGVGSHEQLFKDNSLYQKFCESQSLA